MMPESCGGKKIDELLLRQKITEMITTASLEVDGFLAEVDSESNHIREVKDELTVRQAKALSKSSFWSNIGTAGGAVGSALTIASETANAGSWVGAIAGGGGAAAGLWNWNQTRASGPKGCFPTNTTKWKGSCQAFPCPEQGTPNLGCTPTMLFYLFYPYPPDKDSEGKIPSDQDSKGQKTLFHSDYDAVVRRYVDKRKCDELLSKWDTSSKEKLTSYHGSPMKLSIDELSDRQNKLADLRALVARINRDLSRLSDNVNRYDVNTAPCPGKDGK